MKKLLVLIALFACQMGFSQIQDAIVFFTDKENVAASIANPITILSQAAIDRKQLQGTPIDARDVPVNESYITQIKNISGITVFAKSKWMNYVYVRGTEANINNLLNLSFVESVEFSDPTLNRFPVLREKTDKFESETNGRVIYNYGSATNQTEMLGVDYLHQNDFVGLGIPLAMLDNGYPNVMTNPAYANMISEGRLLGTYDFVTRQTSPNGSGSHGALTFSTIATLLDGQYVGTAPKSSYYLFVTEDNNEENPVEEAYWVEALERSDSLGVYVTNTSLGYQDFDNPNYDHTYQDLDGQTTIGARGANHAFDKGMMIVTSAGNDGNGFMYVGTPGDAPGCFTIGAVDAVGNYASFSSIGPTVDGRVKPDVMAQGRDAAYISTNGDINFGSGTSFSSPILAGAVASLWQARPQTSNVVLRQIITETSTLFNNPTAQMGYGIPNFEEALNVLQVLGIEDQLLETQFALYPNPIETEVNISFPKNFDRATLYIYSVLGAQILKTEISATNNKVDVSKLFSGLYIATIEANGKRTSYKLIKK